MNRVRVKICGITQPEDGLFAALEGADAIGLVFYADSPRNIDVDIANSIIDLLPPFVTKVGLFVNAVHADIESILKTVALDMLQFHGEESREDCNRYSLPYIKAVKMVKDIDLFKDSEVILTKSSGVYKLHFTPKEIGDQHIKVHITGLSDASSVDEERHITVRSIESIQLAD